MHWMPTSVPLIWIPTMLISKPACNFCKTVDLQTGCQTRTALLFHRTYILRLISQHPRMAHQDLSGARHSLHLDHHHPSTTIAHVLQRFSSPHRARHLSCNLLSIEASRSVTLARHLIWDVHQAQSPSLATSKSLLVHLLSEGIIGEVPLPARRVTVHLVLSICHHHLQQVFKLALLRNQLRQAEGSRIPTMVHNQHRFHHHRLVHRPAADLHLMAARHHLRSAHSTSTAHLQQVHLTRRSRTIRTRRVHRRLRAVHAHRRPHWPLQSKRRVSARLTTAHHLSMARSVTASGRMSLP